VKKDKINGWKPEVMPDGSVQVNIGLVFDACCRGIHMLPETAKLLGFKDGDYIQIDHVERDTSIVREYVACQRGHTRMRKNYVYIDGESAHYANVDVNDVVLIKQAPYTVEIP
jgi:propanediol utilization protein